MRSIAWLLPTICVTMMLAGGCPRRAPPTLPNGYRLVKTNAATVVIYEPRDRGSKGLAVGPTIVELGSERQYVFGRVEDSPTSELARSGVPGYFFMDTESMNVLQGLSRAELDDQLRAAQISARMDRP